MKGGSKSEGPKPKRTRARSPAGKVKRRAAPDTSAGLSRVNRRQVVIDEAARLFGRNGFDGTSTRDIADAVGMKSGSLYYHFSSKEDLAEAVHEHRVKEVTTRVQDALAQAGDNPWNRLEAACVAHIVSLLDGTGYPQVVSPQFASALPQRVRNNIFRQRDEYEAMFRGLIDALPLPPQTDRRYLRLAMFGSINWTLTWYHPGGDTPVVIAKKLVAVYRTSLDPRHQT